jgi:hypothetical protein
MAARIIPCLAAVLSLLACARQPMTAEDRAFQRQLLLEQARNWHPYQAPAPRAPVTTTCNGVGTSFTCTSQSNQWLLDSLAHPASAGY